MVAIIVAAGRGERLGGETPKALVDMAGRSMLRRSAEALAACAEVSALIVVAPPGFERIAGDRNGELGKLRAVVAGGATRQDAVRAGLARTTDRAVVVLVHDAARPFIHSW